MGATAHTGAPNCCSGLTANSCCDWTHAGSVLHCSNSRRDSRGGPPRPTPRRTDSCGSRDGCGQAPAEFGALKLRSHPPSKRPNSSKMCPRCSYCPKLCSFIFSATRLYTRRRSK